MNQIKISEDALRDLSEGFLFYEAQEVGIGDYFVSSLRAEIDHLKLSGGIHRIVYDDFHRLICSKFPFGVYYTFESRIVTIWAVLDQRRDPQWIRERLSDKGN